MMQKTATILVVVLLLFASSCSKSLPDQMPNLGIRGDELEFNKYIRLTVPQQLNSYKSGKFVGLEIENLSKQKWNFNLTKDILIYQYQDNKWIEVSDKMVNIGALELTLEPKGQSPLDKQLVNVLPNVKNDQSITLRIFLILHGGTAEETKQTKSGFVDVFLRP